MEEDARCVRLASMHILIRVHAPYTQLHTLMTNMYLACPSKNI